MNEARVVCSFSCGAASAVAAKLILGAFSKVVVVVNIFIKEEHPDNRRFLRDCEKWLGVEIEIIRDRKYGVSTLS